MLDELFLKIMQLAKEDKLELLKALEEDLNYIAEGARFTPIPLSEVDASEIGKRNKELSGDKQCLIEFDDHIAHLQRLCYD